MTKKYGFPNTIKDDPKGVDTPSFKKGMISFAGSGKDSRGTDIFISYMTGPSNLGIELWETPIGHVIKGIENVDSWYKGYGDMPPWGKGKLMLLYHYHCCMD